MAMTAESFAVGDIVFAQKLGYIPWPGKLIGNHSRAGLVQFILTNDSHRIPYGKIWPYNEETKAQFVTRETLEYLEFREAIFITERMLGVSEESIIDTAYALLHPNVEPSEPSADMTTMAPQLSEEEQHDQSLLQQLDSQRDSLCVEPQFIAHINCLRSSLTITKQNYSAAEAAFLELLQLPFSQLMLIRSHEAVNTVRLLCRYTSPSKSEHQLQSQRVRDFAKQLFARFSATFKTPFTQPDFWSEYCRVENIFKRYTVPVVPQSEPKSEEGPKEV